MARTKQSRNPDGTGTYRRRSNGRWEGRVLLPDGTRTSVYADSQKDAQRMVADLVRDARRGLKADRGAVTVAAYLRQWIGDLEERSQVRPSTAKSYRGHIARHIIPSVGKVALRDLTPHHINVMLDTVVKGGASPTTANRIRSTVRAALNDAISARMIPDNAAQLSKPKREHRDRVNPLEIDQIRQLFRHTTDHELGPLIYVAIATGLRQGELLALVWQDVDLDAGELTVRRTLTRTKDGWERSETKTDQSQRTVMLTPGAVRALRKQQALNARKQLLAGQLWRRKLVNPGYIKRGEDPVYTNQHRTDFVFVNARGNPLDNSTVTRRTQELIEAAGLPRQRFHDLRHAFASLMLAEGYDLFTVKEMLGHSQYNLTANLYGHIAKRTAASVADRLEHALEEREG